MTYRVVRTGTTDLLVFGPLVQPTLARHLPSVVPSGVRVVRPVEFGAPHLNDLCEPLEKDEFDLLVQFCNPVFKVGVTFQV